MGALRLVLALSVVVWHLPNTQVKLVHGGSAVILFFIISGFYMALVLNERYVSAREFYMARALRIFPPYYAMCAIAIAWYAYTSTPTLFTSSMGQPLAARVGLIATNVLLIGQDWFQGIINLLTWAGPSTIALRIAAHFPANFFTDPPFMLIGQAWSLGSELLFYLLAPLIVRSLPRILIWFAASVALRTILIVGFGLRSGVWGYQFFPATLCLFLLGSASYHLYAKIRRVRWAEPIGSAAMVTMALLAFAPIVQKGGVLMVDDRGTSYDTLGLWLAYLGFAAALPFLFVRWKNSTLDRWLGELSYPLYLVHGLVIGICVNVIDRPNWAIPASVITAAALYLTVDLPVDRWRHSRLRTLPPVPPSLTLVSSPELAP
jgi:peptidoglycan/LPS O-acetylase OafA/YrhL